MRHKITDRSLFHCWPPSLCGVAQALKKRLLGSGQWMKQLTTVCKGDGLLASIRGYLAISSGFSISRCVVFAQCEKSLSQCACQVVFRVLRTRNMFFNCCSIPICTCTCTCFMVDSSTAACQDIRKNCKDQASRDELSLATDISA